MRRILAPILAAAALAAGAVIALGLLQPPGAERQLSGGVLLEKPRAVRDFELLDEDAEPFGREQLKGRWTAVFPGFTNCPDICPTTLGVLRAAYERLGERAEDWQVVFLSVDPERDRPEALREYVGYFSQDFKALTGDKDTIGQLASDLSIAYQYTPNDKGGYTVDHTAAIVLLDPQGRVAGFLQPPYRPESLSADLRKAAAGFS